MRVLHVTPYFAPAFRYGGPPQSILGLCRGLRSAGVDVEVLTTTANGEREISSDIVRRGVYEGVPVRYLQRSFPRRYFNALGLSDALRQTLPRVDLVHVHGLWSFPVWAAVRESRRAGVPFVVSPRGMLDGGSLGHHRLRKKLGYWARERKYLQRAALLHATSVSEEENLERLSLGPEIVRVPNGVSPPASASVGRFREKLGLAKNDGLVLFLGRLHPMKRLDLLVSAVDKVRAEEPGARLVLAGPEDGLDAQELIGRAFDARTVSWIGEATPDEKWALLSEADVLVSCSDSESFGMSVVEAMAMGTPVVTTQTCPWEDVQKAGAGFWVFQRTQDIADAILTLLRDRDRARAMGERGQKLVHERYRWPAIGRAMSAHYARILR